MGSGGLGIESEGGIAEPDSGGPWVWLDGEWTLINMPIRRTAQSVAFASGVTFTLWSYTLAEGETISGEYKITGWRLNGGTVERSFGYYNFVASRSVGGAAGVTTGTGQEIGTLAGGTISVTTSGNDVLVRMVYTQTGTLTFNDSISLESLSIP